MKQSEFLWTSFAFGHLAANVRVRCSEFSKLRVYAVYSKWHPPTLFGEHCKILRWQTLRKTLKRWWERLEKRQQWRQSLAGTRRRQDRGRDRRRDRRSRGRDRRRDCGDGWWRKGGYREISVAETTVDRKQSPSRMMMKAWRVVWVMQRQPQHTGRPLIRQITVRPHGLLIHASGSSAYEIFCSLFPDELLALLVEETNRYYDQTVTALGDLDNLPS